MVPLLPLVVLDLGVSVPEGGLLLTAPALIGALAGLWAGPAMDRRGRRPLVVAGLLLVGACSLAMAAAPSFWVAVALRAGTGLGMTALFPATLSAAGEYFSYRESGKAMGLAISAGSSAPLLGVPLGRPSRGSPRGGWRCCWSGALPLAWVFCCTPSYRTIVPLPKRRAPLRECGTAYAP